MLVTIFVSILVGVIAFFGGIKYQLTLGRNTNFSRQFQIGQVGNNRDGQGRFTGSGRPVAGEILSADDRSITVKLQDGSSKIVLFSDKTSISNASDGSTSDLKTGVKVAVFGTENTDGSLTATNIQLNPTFGGMRGRLPN